MASLAETGGFLLRPFPFHFPFHFWHQGLRLLLVVLVLALSGWYLQGQLRVVDWALVGTAMGALGALQIAGGLLAAVTAFVAVAGQERAVVAWLALPIGPADGARAAMTAAAISQTVGFGPVVGALVRHRMMRGLTLGQSLAISAGMTAGFVLGVAVLVVATLAISPSFGGAGPARAALLGVSCLVVLLALRRGAWGGRWPNLLIMGRFLLWLSVDLTALGGVLWLVLPAGHGVSFWLLLPVFLIGIGLGVMSGSPAALGPFEAMLLPNLPQVPPEAMLAAIVMFRLLAYLVPALCGLVWLALGRAGQMGALALREVSSLPRQTLQTLPLPDAHLIRQGEIGLLSGQDGWLWLTGRLAHTRVLLGDPVADRPAQILAQVAAMARREGRLLCLYKIGPRMAVQARRAGLVVMPVAQEAVLNPQTFVTSGPDRARLRRKLSHARKAGLQIGQPDRLPYDEMATVAQAWAARQGGERGFSVGRYEAGYVAGQRVVLARAPDGRLVAFVSFHTGPAGWVLDLMRFGTDAPDGTIYALLCHAIDLARAEGVTQFSLSAVPDGSFGLRGPLARLVQGVVTGKSGLAQFKSAFAPTWQPRYMAAPGRLALTLGAAGVARAVLRPARLIPVPYGDFMDHDGQWGAGAASDPVPDAVPDAGPDNPADRPLHPSVAA